MTKKEANKILADHVREVGHDYLYSVEKIKHIEDLQKFYNEYEYKYSSGWTVEQIQPDGSHRTGWVYHTLSELVNDFKKRIY